MAESEREKVSVFAIDAMAAVLDLGVAIEDGDMSICELSRAVRLAIKQGHNTNAMKLHLDMMMSAVDLALESIEV